MMFSTKGRLVCIKKIKPMMMLFLLAAPCLVQGMYQREVTRARQTKTRQDIDDSIMGYLPTSLLDKWYPKPSSASPPPSQQAEHVLSVARTHPLEDIVVEKRRRLAPNTASLERLVREQARATGRDASHVRRL